MDRASRQWTHVTQLVPTAAVFATAVANHAGVRVVLQGSKFFQTRFPANGVVVLPLSVGDDGLPDTTLDGILGGAPIALLKSVGPHALEICAFSPDNAVDSPFNVFGRVGAKVFLDPTCLIKGVQVGDAVADVMLTHAEQGNAPPLPAPPAPADGQAALLEMMATGHNATTRTLYKALVPLAFGYDDPRFWTALFATGYTGDGLGTAKDFTPAHAIDTFKSCLRDMQRATTLDPKTNIYSDKEILLLFTYKFGSSGDDKVSLKPFNLAADYDPKAKTFTLAAAQQCVRTYAKFVNLTHGPAGRMAGLILFMMNCLLDSVDFDPSDGARLLVLVHNQLALVPLAPTECLRCDPPVQPMDWLHSRWSLTRESPVILQHEATYMKAQIRDLSAKRAAEAAAAGGAAGAEDTADPTTGAFKRVKHTPQLKNTTPTRTTKPAAPRRASLEEIRKWNEQRPAFLGKDEKVMCKQVARGQQCTNPRCRSNDAYTNDDPAKMAAVRSWAKKSPFGK
jgi:hypothetical protein